MIQTEERTLLKLDLGCGQHCEDGFEGVDIADIPGVAYVHDLRVTPWVWEDGSVGEVRCSHFLEHLTGAERIVFMNELWRVMADGGKALITVPYAMNPRAWQDPTHQWPPISESSFLYFNKGWREANGLDHYPIHCDFDFTYAYNIAQDWAVRSEEARFFAVRHYMGVVADVVVTLVKRPT